MVHIPYFGPKPIRLFFRGKIKAPAYFSFCYSRASHVNPANLEVTARHLQGVSLLLQLTVES